MHPLSKGFYLGSIIGASILAMVLLSIGFIVAQDQDESAMAFLCAGYLPLIYTVVIVCVLLYKAWSAIQDGAVRTTPGKAVGFMFIPLFNIYWQFQALWGLAKDYNAYGAQKGLSLPRLPEGLALTMCILTLLAWIPFLGIVIALVNFVITIIFWNAVIDGYNALAASRAEGAPASEEAPPPIA
jgi:hypothetical protein